MDANISRPDDPRGDLREYRRKRDFERTAEPRGADAPIAGGRLFVVQKHAARQLHYDLRLEMDGVLKSWAVPRGPSLDPSQKPLAVLVEDHPLEYGGFEGIIPKGEYGGGTVMLWDRGEWEPIGDPVAGFEKGDLKFRLRGEKLRGAWVLARMSGRADEGGRNWLLIKKKDAESRSVESFNVLAEMPFSVLSGRSMEQIEQEPEAVWSEGRARSPGGEAPRARVAGRPGRPDPSALPGARRGGLPDALAPQLATRARTPPEGEGWLHEIKHDGYRITCRIERGAVRLLTRNGHDWTDRMPEVAAAAARLPLHDAILDGEVVVLDAEGISDFQALQNAFRGYRQRPFVYYLFDVPFAEGWDLRQVPLVERKGLLEKVVRGAPLAAPTIQYCEHLEGRGRIVFEQAAAAGLEGIVSKRADSSYESRRTESWRKVKATRRRDFLVVGFTTPSGSRSGFGALLLGHHDPGGRLVYCGRVGTGFSDRRLEELATALAPLVRETPPVIDPGLDPGPGEVRWVEPTLVADVEFARWTDEKLVRHAAFRGLRTDVDPRDVRREEDRPGAAGRGGRPRAPARGVVRAPASPGDAFVAGVRISHPERTVYPEDGVTKLDVARYYEAVAARMLPYVVRRPLSLVRCPLGLAGEAFYQRELGEGFPDSLRGLRVERGRDGSEDHAIVIDDRAGLVALAQMGGLEIHAWGCREDNLRRPDHLVFDLDPGPGLEWGDVVASALVVRDFLSELGLRSFVKTSGGHGLHVVVPVVRRTDWPQVKAFARGVAETLARRHPLNFVSTVARSQREQRVFVDYLRNQLGATSVAIYSTRARPGATVSAPLGWSELSAGLGPRELNVRTVPGRLEPDPWAGYRDVRQSLTAAVLRRVKASGAF